MTVTRPKRLTAPTHLDTWAGQSAPRAGEKGYRAPPAREPGAFGNRSPFEIAETAVARALELREDPDVAAMWWIEPDAVDELGDPELWTQADLPDLLGLPYQDASGRELSQDERIGLAFWVFERVCADGYPPHPVDARYLRDGWRLDPWAVAAVLADKLDPDQRLRIVEVTKEQATAFVAAHHSHLPEINLRGTMFVLGLHRGDRLVAVATAGTPTGRWKDQHRVLELTRVASDGTTLNASSMLTGRILDLLKRTGRTLFVTYTFPGEAGTSYKALKDKGLRPVRWTKDHGTQARKDGGSSRSANGASCRKLRWEAGPDAGKARWDLIR